MPAARTRLWNEDPLPQEDGLVPVAAGAGAADPVPRAIRARVADRDLTELPDRPFLVEQGARVQGLDGRRQQAAAALFVPALLEQGLGPNHGQSRDQRGIAQVAEAVARGLVLKSKHDVPTSVS